MAQRQTTPAGLRAAALVLMIGAPVVGIGMPVLFTYLKITSVEIATGIDLMLILLPIVGITDLVMALFLWRRANAMEPRGGGGPVVG